MIGKYIYFRQFRNKNSFYGARIIMFFFCFLIIYTLYLNYNHPFIRKNYYGLNRFKLKNIFFNKPKYILQWTLPDTVPFVYMGIGQDQFVNNDCTFNNCYVTSNDSLLESVSMFDIIAFHGPELTRNELYNVPLERSIHQKYIFVAIESSENYPLCNLRYNDFFNLTWTYKLSSDVPYSYMVIRDKNNKTVGPEQIIHWIKLKNMKPIGKDIKKKLLRKTKAAAWFVSDCFAMNRREYLVNEIQKELRKFGLDVDIYGNCGTLQCPMDDEEKCFQIIEKDYFFYIAFENSNASDYVTEKVLVGLQHYSVPVVFGTANYTRFMPDGIYLNGYEMGAVKLAKAMSDLINNREKYYEMFKWHNHYSYHSRIESSETDPMCELCKMANSPIMRRKTTYPDFLHWWNDGKCS